MADALYLSLWYPNLRLAELEDKLVRVLGEFATHGGESRVYSATVWPVSWSEAPVFQRIYRAVSRTDENGQREYGVEPAAAVAEALEMLHEDYAYEFQIGWNLWEPETIGEPTARWVRELRQVRVTAFGPLFDEGAYEQDGHIRIDFGPDGPFMSETPADDLIVFGAETSGVQAAQHLEENIRQLIGLTHAVEKASGATARLLWSELGESLAVRLAQRLNVVN